MEVLSSSRRAGRGPDRAVRAAHPAAGGDADRGRAGAGRARGGPAGLPAGAAGRPDWHAAPDHGTARPAGPAGAGARGGRLRVPPRPHLRHAAGQHRHRQARRHAPRPGGRYPGGLAARASRHRGELPGPGRSFRRRRPHRRAGRDPGGRPVAPMAQPGRARREDRRRPPPVRPGAPRRPRASRRRGVAGSRPRATRRPGGHRPRREQGPGGAGPSALRAGPGAEGRGQERRHGRQRAAPGARDRPPLLPRSQRR